MTAPTPPKILIFGAGSIGGVHIHQFQRAGCHVTAICRTNYTAVSSHGFKLYSKRFGNVTYRPDAVVQSASECSNETFNFIFISSKSFPGSTPSLPDMIRPVLASRPDTAIILAQNGIGIEDEVHAAYPHNPLLSCVVYMPATQTAPGILHYGEMLNNLEIGTFPSTAPPPHKAAAERLADLVRAGGGEAVVYDDIQVPRWSKIIVNASWNPICALSLCTDADFLTSSSPYAMELVWGVMMEIVNLAQVLKIPGIDEGAAKWQLQRAKDRVRDRAGREMSMLQDVKAGRMFEVEAIVGNTVRLGREHGVRMVLLEAVYALARGRYEAMGRSRESEREKARENGRENGRVGGS
jgi:2-dehydropantoate 2-reductase